MSFKFSDIRQWAFNEAEKQVIQQRMSFHDDDALTHFASASEAQSILSSGVLKARGVSAHEMDDEEPTKFVSFTDENFWDEPNRSQHIRERTKKDVAIAFKKSKVRSSGGEKVKYTKQWFNDNFDAIPYILDAPIFNRS